MILPTCSSKPLPCILNLQAYVLGALGPAYVEPQEFRLSAIYADSSPSVPLIFVLRSVKGECALSVIGIKEFDLPSTLCHLFYMPCALAPCIDVLTCLSPPVLLHSFGSDPMADLLRFADEKRKQVGLCGPHPRGRSYRSEVYLTHITLITLMRPFDLGRDRVPRPGSGSHCRAMDLQGSGRGVLGGASGGCSVGD